MELSPKADAKGSTISGHTAWSIFHSEGWIIPAWPYLLLFWLWLVYLIFGAWIWSRMIHHFPSLEIGDVVIDEDIDNYYKALDDEDRLWTIKEEENCRNVLGMKCMPEDAFNRLKCAISSDATIEGVHTYDILANPLYTDSFQYFSAALPDREMYIVDDDDDEDNDNVQSDLVRAALNLAYMTEDKAITFKFDKEQFRIRKASTANSSVNDEHKQSLQNEDDDLLVNPNANKDFLV